MGHQFEVSRNEKLKSLGALCYNLYQDGIMPLPEFSASVSDVKQNMDSLIYLRQSGADDESIRMQDGALSDSIISLGCVCYNLYIDNKLVSNDLLTLCKEVHEANQMLYTPMASMPAESVPYMEQAGLESDDGGLEMEPIPDFYKECVCGYKNRTDAFFCAKCGASLEYGEN